MLYANSEFKGNRIVYGFDSFEGIPIAGAKDKQQPGLGYFDTDTNPFFPNHSGKIESSGVTVHSLQGVKLKVVSNGFADNCKLIKGWFQDTLPNFSKEKQSENFKISLLRLDADLYESTKVALNELWQFLGTLSTVIVDDYYTCAGAKLAVDELLGDVNIKNLGNVGYLTL
jgi:hypothetical protein